MAPLLDFQGKKSEYVWQMKNLFENFTLYDLVGYFAVGLISYICLDLAWHWSGAFGRLSKIWACVGGMNVYQAGLAGVAAYTFGQLLGSASKFFYFKILHLKWWKYPEEAWKDWPWLRQQLLEKKGQDKTDSSPQSIFWLCICFSRERAPSTYEEAFKWLVYSGASRTFSLVSLALAAFAAIYCSWWHFVLFIVLALIFTYSFARLLKQYHDEVLNSVLLVLNDRLPQPLVE
jgi:hypothetical protein